MSTPAPVAPAPVCRCDPKLGGFVYNCPVHAKHVIFNSKPHFAWEDPKAVAEARANRTSMGTGS